MKRIFTLIAVLHILAVAAVWLEAGNVGDAPRFNRERMDIGRDYGRLVAATVHGEEDVLWYENDQGEVRNIRVKGGSSFFSIQSHRGQ